MTSSTALIVRGGWEGHAPIAAIELFVPFLEEQGYAISIEESPAVYADEERMRAVDLIVQSVTMSTIERDELAGLAAAVERGTGLAGWHGGIADSYRNSSDYLQLIGGQFATHPSKAPEFVHGDETDNFVPYTVNVTELGRQHPVMDGIEDFDLHTEQYWVLNDDLIDVLATTTHPAPAWHPWHRPVTSPVVWTRLWGAGRIFVATPGHNVAVLQNENVNTIVKRGMLWALSLIHI